MFGTAVTGSPYATGAQMNAGSGTAYVRLARTRQPARPHRHRRRAEQPERHLRAGAVDRAETTRGSAGCGNANGCQLGAWATTDGGATWTFMAGSAGGSLKTCATPAPAPTPAAGDYPQNWYDQGVAVDPNNPDRVFVDTFDVWLATRTGTAWYDMTCGYSGPSPKPVHVDQHALAFVPGSSSILLAGNDGGVHGTTNADAAALNTLARRGSTWTPA